MTGLGSSCLVPTLLSVANNNCNCQIEIILKNIVGTPTVPVHPIIKKRRKCAGLQLTRVYRVDWHAYSRLRKGQEHRERCCREREQKGRSVSKRIGYVTRGENAQQGPLLVACEEYAAGLPGGTVGTCCGWPPKEKGKWRPSGGRL